VGAGFGEKEGLGVGLLIYLTRREVGRWEVGLRRRLMRLCGTGPVRSLWSMEKSESETRPSKKPSGTVVKPLLLRRRCLSAARPWREGSGTEREDGGAGAVPRVHRC
jgi:hypothetical protein